MEPLTSFDTQLHAFLADAARVLPERSLRILETKIRQVHADRPELDLPDICNIALDVLAGEAQDMDFAADQAEAEAARLAFLAEQDRQRALALRGRIMAAEPEVKRLVHLYPGRTTFADILTDAGKTWADLGLTKADGELLQELFDEEPAQA